MKYLKYSGQIVIAVAVIVLVLVFFGPCGNKKINQQYKALQAEARQLRDKVTTDSITRTNQRIAENAQLAVQRQETAAAIADKKAADKKLTETQRRMAQLSAMITNSPEIPDNSDTACKELAAQIPVLNQQINDYRTQADEAVDLLNYEVLLRDSIIENEKAYSDSLRNDFNMQSVLLKRVLKESKPRGKFLAGAGVIGNQTSLLSGAKVTLAYQTKGGKQYQGGAILMGGTVWYEAGVLIQVFK